MANVNNNRLSVTIAATALAVVKTNLQQVNTQLPFFTGLTMDERVQLPKISVANKQFVADSLTALNNNPTLVPPYMNVAELQKDYTLYEQLDELLLIITELQEKIRDTQMLAGSEAFSSALMAYKMFQVAADAGVPGTGAIYDSLRQRFAGQGGTATPPPSPQV